MEQVIAADFDAELRYAGALIRPGVARFRGIPYAARPSWGPPLAPHPHGLVAADAAGPVPPQSGVPESATGPGSYLSVSIDAPWPPDRSRPVLVWLCVAGNVAGRADRGPIAASTLPDAGIVVVGVQARLGAHGFAVVDDAPDNRAALDWLAALSWVQERIAAFGGDPEAVTLAGQSAGGGAVSALLASRRSAGLFQRAIVMSSATPSTRREPARATTAAFAARLGVEPTAADLETVPYQRLVDAVADEFGPRWRVDDPVQRVRNMRLGPPFRIVDDPSLDLGPVVPALASGAGETIPLLIGSTAEEFTESFAALKPSRAELPAALAAIGEGSAGFRADPDASPGAVLGQAFTDAVFRLTPRRMAAARAGAAAPTFLYEVGPFRDGPSVRHGADVAAALGAPDDALPRPAARALTAACARFIVTGAPGWEPWRERHEARRFGDRETDAGAELDRIAEAWRDA